MKRHHIITVIILSLLVPQLATALPRPDAVQSEPEQQLGPTLTIQANDSTGIATPVLIQDREYRFEVSGIWRPSGDINNKADAACETTNNVNWSKTGKGFVIFAINYGSPSNSLGCRNDHTYGIKYQGRGVSEAIRINDPGNYSDNSGSLTVKIWTQNKVSYTTVVSRPIDLVRPGTPEIGRFDFQPYEDATRVSQTATAQTPDVDSPVPVPELFLIRFHFDPGTGQCAGNPPGREFYITGHVAGVPFNTADLQKPCILNLAPGVYDDLANRRFSAGGGDGRLVTGTTFPVTITATSICEQLRLVTPTLNSPAVGGQGGQCGFVLQKERQEETLIPLIPPGSSVNLILTWSADTSRLWKTPANDRDPQSGNEANALWAPFRPQDASWFASEVQAGRLALKVGLFIQTPSGPIGLPQIASIPGMGQLMEALFHTRANCTDESQELC